MKQIKAINTFYNGYHFRSRLEARWAVFFDALGVKYEYEPEGYVLPNGECYLPDFVIDGLDTCHGFVPRLFVEVKNGECLSNKEAEKIIQFHNDGENQILVVGDIREALEFVKTGNPLSEVVCKDPVNNIGFYSFELIDGDCYPTFFGLDKKGNVGLAGGDYDSHYFAIDILKALEIACKVRFEHGYAPTSKEVRRQLLRQVLPVAIEGCWKASKTIYEAYKSIRARRYMLTEDFLDLHNKIRAMAKVYQRTLDSLDK